MRNNPVMNSRTLIRIASMLLAMAVACGAFGAHGLRGIVTPERLAVWDKAVLYQMVHGLALLAFGLAGAGGGNGAVNREARASSADFLPAAKIMIFGIVVFSGSLYLLVLTDTAWLGAITPIGGIAMIAAWTMIGVAASRS